MRKLVVLSFLMLAVSISVGAQTNLLRDPDTRIPASGTPAIERRPRTQAWRGAGHAEVKDAGEGFPVYAVSMGGSFGQEVSLPAGSAGKHALLIGFGTSDRVFPDNDITDHPYLYGYMNSPGRIVDYLQGQRMLWESRDPNEWRCLYGVFQIPEGTTSISFFLNQAQRRGTEHDGSIARFSRPGLFIFDTAAEASEYAATYCTRTP